MKLVESTFEEDYAIASEWCSDHGADEVRRCHDWLHGKRGPRYQFGHAFLAAARDYLAQEG